MSRQIKFRLFSEKIKGFISVGDKTSLTFEDTLVADDGYKLMQYTGLKDKKCVEIYEGDIVTVEFPNTPTSAEVFYNETQCAFRPKSSYQTIYNFDFSRCEVIGNIYENKELLNV